MVSEAESTALDTVNILEENQELNGGASGVCSIFSFPESISPVLLWVV